MTHLAEKRGFLWWTRWYLATSYMMMWGLFLASFAGSRLAGEMQISTHSPWFGVVYVFAVLTSLWACWAFFPRELNFSNNELPHQFGFRLLVVIGAMVLYWQRHETWSVACLGPCTAAYLWWFAKRPYGVPFLGIAGSILASPVALLFQWPNVQRFLLVVVLSGLSTALQGAIVLTHYLRTLPKRRDEAISNSS